MNHIQNPAPQLMQRSDLQDKFVFPTLTQNSAQVDCPVWVALAK